MTSLYVLSVLMEKRKEVDTALGKDNVDEFLSEIEKGHLKNHELRTIASKIGGKSYGTYVAKQSESLSDCAKYMLDTWYIESLHQPGRNWADVLFQIVKFLKWNAFTKVRGNM